MHPRQCVLKREAAKPYCIWILGISHGVQMLVFFCQRFQNRILMHFLRLAKVHEFRFSFKKFEAILCGPFVYCDETVEVGVLLCACNFINSKLKSQLHIVHILSWYLHFLLYSYVKMCDRQNVSL